MLNSVRTDRFLLILKNSLELRCFGITALTLKTKVDAVA